MPTMAILLGENTAQWRYGDVAQLGEHLLCTQGVGGSSPLISTSSRIAVASLTGASRGACASRGMCSLTTA